MGPAEDGTGAVGTDDRRCYRYMVGTHHVDDHPAIR